MQFDAIFFPYYIWKIKKKEAIKRIKIQVFANSYFSDL